MMNRISIAVCVVCGLATAVDAQVEVSLRVQPSRAVMYEPVIAHVRIQNNTGSEITLDDSGADGRLWMEIERVPGRPVRQREPKLLAEPIIIPPHESVTRRINISRAYDLRSTGQFNVRARVNLAGRSLTSGRAFLDLVPGMEVTRLSGAAGPEGSQPRLYRLLTLNRDRGEHLFLRVDDEDAGICYAVVHLGSLVRIQPPKMRIDESNHLTILHQTGPARYLYHVFTPNGQLVQRRLYTSEERGVTLERSANGNYIVSGAAASITD